MLHEGNSLGLALGLCTLLAGVNQASSGAYDLLSSYYSYYFPAAEPAKIVPALKDECSAADAKTFVTSEHKVKAKTAIQKRINDLMVALKEACDPTIMQYNEKANPFVSLMLDQAIAFSKPVPEQCLKQAVPDIQEVIFNAMCGPGWMEWLTLQGVVAQDDVKKRMEGLTTKLKSKLDRVNPIKIIGDGIKIAGGGGK